MNGTTPHHVKQSTYPPHHKSCQRMGDGRDSRQGVAPRHVTHVPHLYPQRIWGSAHHCLTVQAPSPAPHNQTGDTPSPHSRRLVDALRRMFCHASTHPKNPRKYMQTYRGVYRCAGKAATHTQAPGRPPLESLTRRAPDYTAQKCKYEHPLIQKYHRRQLIDIRRDTLCSCQAYGMRTKI